MKPYRIILSLFLIFVNVLSLFAEDTDERFSSFTGGNIVSVKGNYAIYSKATNDGLMYGMCFYDEQYTPTYSLSSQRVNKADGRSYLVQNSNTYSILPPIYDKVQPISNNLIAVCTNGKWAYIDDNCCYVTDFVFDAAMPPLGGSVKVMINGNIESIDINSLRTNFISDTASMRNLAVKADLIEQLYNECQYDKAIDFSLNYIKHSKPNNISNLTSDELLHLIRVQFCGKGAQNQALATTIHSGIENRFPGAFNYYKQINIDDNNSFLQSSPLIVKDLTKLLFDDLQIELPNLFNKLSNVYSLFGISEYKKCVVSLENMLQEESLLSEQPYVNLLYVCLLHVAGDYERYNIVIHRLSQEVANEFNPILSITHEAFTNHFANAIDKIRALKKSNNTQEKYLALALEGKIFDFIGMEKDALKSYTKALGVSTSKSLNTASQIEILQSATLLAYNNNDSSRKSLLKKYLQAECSLDCELFSALNTLQISKEWGFSRARIEQVINQFALSNYDECVEAAFKLSIFEKSILNDRQLDWYHLANISGDDTIAQLFDRYNQLRTLYSGVDIYNLNEEYNDDFLEMMSLETDIKSIIYQQPPSVYDYYFGDVINRVTTYLDNASCAIDFFQFSKNGENRIGAWLIKRGCEIPLFYDIANVNEIIKYDASDESSINRAYSSNGNLIWGNFPISDMSSIYFSPSSSISKLGVEYFFYNDAPLSANYNTIRLSSIFNIANINNAQPQLNNIALFGGLDYGTGYMSETRAVVRSGFLKYSQKEVDEIERLYGDTISVKKFTGYNGSASVFKELQNISPDIIHLATHGYQSGKRPMIHFGEWNRFNYYNQNTDLEDEDWLLSTTGLYLSPDQSTTNNINNIIRSKEVSLCRLSNTALVVLSACNTSDGENSAGYDYIIGLNYAFQKTSVQNIITSLWDVYDEATYEFMVSFYSKLQSKSIHDAFRSTVNEFWVANKQSPKYWSSFILIHN